MNLHTMKTLIAGLCALVLLSASPVLAAGTKVFVSILPQKYLVERIGGDLVDVRVLVMPGANPHMYEPTPGQMQALSTARAYFAVGVNLEDVWLPRFAQTNPTLRIIPTQEGIEKIPMAAHGHGHEHEGVEDHEHEAAAAEGHHDHEDGILDPHIWLDPLRARAMAGNICAGLVEVDPANRAVYEANLATLLKDIQELDKTIVGILSAVPENKRSFMVFHPSWGYFAQRYHLIQVPIEDHGTEPGPRYLKEIIEHGREEGISVVFVQPQFSQKAAKVIASELGARVLPLDPLAEDWKDNLLRAAEAFRQALK